MGFVINLVAVIISIASLVAALGHVGYLVLLNNAAKQRAGGGPISEYIRGRWALAGGTTAASLIAWLLTTGGTTPDILAILIAGGSGVVTSKALQSTQAKFPTGGK